MVNTSFLTLTFLLIMYSFGTFGLLNLFDLRSEFQTIAIGLILITFVLLSPYKVYKNTYLVLFFIFIYTSGRIFYSDNLLIPPLEALIYIFIIYTLFSVPKTQIVVIGKLIVIFTSFFCLLILLAFIFYNIYPEEIFRSNIFIYYSETGSKKIFPHSFIDWISFTSGDGFNFGDHIFLRLKGYSNEPSTTTVHYLAPAILAFFLRGNYRYLGIFILLINIVIIASIITHIIIFLSIAFLFMAKIFGKHFRQILFLSISTLLIILVNPFLTLSIFEFFNEIVINNFDIDLIKRKITGESLEIRNNGIVEGFRLILTTPFGYSYDKTISSGLFYFINSNCGWLGLFIILYFSYKVVSLIADTIITVQETSIKYSMVLFLSIFFIVLFVSGYGWNRPPGIIMLILPIALALKIKSRDAN